MKTIQLHKGKEPINKYAVIDDDDYEDVSRHEWKILVTKWGSYAKRYETIPGTGKARTILMHRQIASPPDGMLVDHINGDGLDNRRSNLRVVTPSENNFNRKATRSDNSSGFTGVHTTKRGRGWGARIHSGGRSWYLGVFHCPVEAAIFRDIAAIEIHGSMAHLNFPKLMEVFGGVTNE